MNYYVYSHSTSDKVIKYIGSGTRDRANDIGNRSNKWHECFDNQELIVKIIVDDLTIDEARQLEDFFINKYKSTLLNSRKVANTYKMIYNDFFETFEIDNKLASGLKYKIDNNGTGRNKRKKGEMAGTRQLTRGKFYWTVKLRSKTYYCHRIIYLLHYGQINSNLVINHIDNNSENNTISNLEQISTAENSRNKSLVNQSGHVNIQENIRNGIFKGYMFLGKAYGLPFKYFSFKVYGSKETALIAAVKHKTEVLNHQKENNAK